MTTHTELPYVLVADASVERAALCLESLRPFNIGTLIARDGDEATRLLDRFGPPVLLIVDLSLSRKDGFALIEAVRGRDRMRTEILAWSAFRELREFAASRLAGQDVHVLSASSPAPAVVGAITRALQRRAAAPANRAAIRPEDFDRMMGQLADKASQLCRTPGVAVYVRVPGTTQFRASVTWSSDTPIPHSPYYIPEVFGRVLETGEVLVLPDLATQPLAGVPTATLEDVVRGLVAVPITGVDSQVIGTLCVFDLQPLAIGEPEVAALRALGQSVSLGAVLAPDAGEDRTAAASDEQASGAPDPGSVERPAPAASAVAHAAPEVPVVHWPTAILDRTSGEFAVRRELARAKREQRPVSVVMFDVSPAGSPGAATAETLVDIIGDTLLKAIRQSDLPVIWSDDELVVVLPGLTTVEARAVAERVRAALHAGAGYRAAVSAGVAEVLADDSVNAVMERAKDKVRLALERGHNRVA
jgi:GGDEF domain-containing protein/CheY-like chemotaxis protein